MSIASFFQKLFKLNGTPQSDAKNNQGVQAKLLNGNPSEYATYSGEFYANSLVRSITHRIATYASMISFEHVRGYGEKFEILRNSSLNRLLNVKPNSFMTPADLQYKTWTDLLITNNAYQWLQRDRNGEITAILPVVANQVEFVEVNGFPFYRFSFSTAKKQ